MDTSDDLTLALGQRLRKLREQRGFTARELGVLIGLKEEAAAQHIYRYEHGVHAPHVRHLAALAKALNVSVAELIGETPPKAWLLARLAPHLDRRTVIRLAKCLGVEPPPSPPDGASKKG